MEPAIFLDRDGVIIENQKNYVRSWSDVSFIPAALSALRDANSKPYKFVLVTNQSAVGRGIISIEQAKEINQQVKTVIEAFGGRLDGIYLCPHAPQDHCACRKPQPGMLLKAAEELQIDLTSSYMIGDALTDLKAGRAANVRESILVRTGRGEVQATLPEAIELQPFPIFDTLSEALETIFAQSKEE